MLRNLLADRFKMEFHYESKEIQGYELVVSKGGAKVRLSTGVAPSSAPNRQAPPGSAGKDGDGFPMIPAEDPRPMASAVDGNRFVQRFRKRTMGQLAAYLANALAKPVNDATGLEESYDFTLKWAITRVRPVSSDDGPSLFDALQSQLGLKLEPKKVATQVLIVDHMERTPTEN